MLVRVRGYNSGFANYLRTGQKNGNHLHRDDLDKRLILSGDLDITDEIVNAMPDTGDDRYLHIAIPFKEDYISEEVLKTVIDDFKNSLMNAYRDDEYAFYAEAHIPKIKRVLNEKTGEMEDRKPHIHVIIPKVNLVDGSYLNPLGYYPHNEKYVEAIQESINYRYGFESPRDNRRFSVTDISDFISKYKGDFFKSDVRNFKENLLTEVLTDKDLDYAKFMSKLDELGKVIIRNPGEKQYLNVTPEGHVKGVNLKDYVFTKYFIDLSYEEKISFITSSSGRRDEEKKQLDFERDEKLLTEWLNRRSHEIKHFHPNSKEFKKYKKLPDNEKQDVIDNLLSVSLPKTDQIPVSSGVREINIQNLLIERMKEKYNVRRKKGSEKSSILRNDGAGLLRLNNQETQKLSQYSVRQLQFGQLDSTLYKQTRVLLQSNQYVVMDDGESGVSDPVRYPIDRADAGRGGRRIVIGTWHAQHETEVRYTLNDINRSSDSYLESVRSDVAERLIEDAASGEPDWQLIRSRMNGHQLLKSLQHTHGLDIAKYSVTKSRNGEDRILCGTRSYSVNDFLTKELNLNWQEAGEYLKLEYARQIRKEVINDFVAPSRSYWHQFKEWDREQNLYSTGWKSLKEDHARQRTLLNKSFREKSSEVWKDNTLTLTEKKSNVAALRLQKLRARQVLQEQQKEERALLKESLSTYNRFLEYLRILADEGDRHALEELRKASKRQTTKPDSNYFESQTDSITVLLDKVTYAVKNNGSVSYLINNKEAVIDSREWVSVVQKQNDEAIELAIRLALEKNGYRPLTLNGDELFIENVLRVAKEKNIRVSFENDGVNKKFISMNENQQSDVHTNKMSPKSH
ncbi:LPD7 domain-containing protein [Enterobacter ludwigii]|uniref:LPD7 domain-containing protein n=1 Tax=Enterobacter ludwigii TaxID=299767 RepID=UPI003BA2938C